MRHLILAIITLAVLVTAPLSVQSEETKGKWWIEGGAQFIFWDGTKNLIGDGITGSIKPGDGYGIFGEIGYHMPDSPWSISFGAKYGENKSQSKAVDSVVVGALLFFGSNTTNKEHFLRWDVVLGYDVNLAMFPNAEAKIIGGLRFLRFHADENGTILDTNSGVNGPDNTDRRFAGLGPRIGVEISNPLTENTAVEMKAAAALLFGKRKFKKNLTALLAGGGPLLTDTTTRSKSAVVPNLEFFMGLSYLFPGTMMKVTGGYHVDAYFNVMDAGCRCFAKKGDRIFHGPKLKVRVPF